MLRPQLSACGCTTRYRLVRNASSSLVKGSDKPRGRPRKAAVIGNDISRHDVKSAGDAAETPTKFKKSGSVEPKQQRGSLITHQSSMRESNKQNSQLPPRISSSMSLSKHCDLDSFLAYASQAQLNPSSNVYRGTHYEYTVAKCMQAYNFTLLRTGQSNDLGIDLIGRWDLPEAPYELRVLVQCKATQPKPSMIRELEGAFAGAPAGWSDDGVMVLLATAKPITPGVRQALQRSRFAMGILQVTTDGKLQQFVWNQTAHDSRLSGLTAVNTYSTVSGAAQREVDIARGVIPSISLLWMGKPWKRSR